MIEVRNVKKRYGDFEAVRGISFTADKGTVYGFLGPNGAGKSTTMNIITGCLAATEGEVFINGCDIYEDPAGAKSAVGYLPEQPPLYLDMTVEEYLEFVGEAKGLRGEKLFREIDRVVKRTALKDGTADFTDRLINNLSKGYRQRVGIAQALLADPEIIILDEPTVGLDPRQIIEIRDLIRELGHDHCVILSSHILTEISAVCDYVIIISHGEIVASDKLENLTKLGGSRNYIDLTVRGDESAVRRMLSSVPGVISVEIETKDLGLAHVRIAIEQGTDIRETVFFRFADARIPILSMNYEEITLEKIFLALTADKAADPSAEEPDEEDMSPEDAVAQRVLENTKRRLESLTNGEESVPEAPGVPEMPDKPEMPAAPQVTPEPQVPQAPEDTETSAADKAGKKKEKSPKKSKDDDYTPLFGGRD